MSRIGFIFAAVAAVAAATAATVGLRPATEVLKSTESVIAPADSATTPDAARLLADIKKFRIEAGKLEPAVAAQRWFDLYDRAKALGTVEVEGDLEAYDDVTNDAVGRNSVMAAIPSPTAWPTMRNLATARAAGKADAETLGLKYLTELLVADRTAALATLAAIDTHRKQLPPDSRNTVGDAVRRARSTLTRTYSSADERVAALQSSLESSGYEEIEIPDLVAVVGAEEARPLLTKAIGSPQSIKIQGGNETRALMRQIAVANVAKMKIAQWRLVDGVDAAPLFEAISQRFPRDASDEDSPTSWKWSEAALYYFLAMVRDGKQTQAERTLDQLSGEGELYIPKNAIDALQRAGLNEPLFRFLNGQLAKRPDLRAWNLYIEQAAYTGHGTEALKLIDTLLLRKDLPKFVVADLRVRRIGALLAADNIDAAAQGYRVLLAEAPTAGEPGLETRVTAAVNAAKVGRLTGHKDLSTLGLGFAAKASGSGLPGESGCKSIGPLFAELRRQDRAAEAQQLAIECLNTHRKPKAEGFEALMNPGDEIGRAALIELVSIYLAAGKPHDALALLQKSSHWGSEDVATLVGVTDSLGVPLGATVAQVLHETKDEAAALRVARATIAALPGRDAAYETVAALDRNAAESFEASYRLDPFEERPLIWKSIVLLKAGKVDEAEKTVRRAIEIDPSDGEEGPNDRMRAYAVLSDILARKKNTPDSQLFAGAVAAIRISEGADALHEAGLYERAFEGYREALTKFSDAYCIQSRLAVQLSKQGRRQEAVAHYRRAYELMPSSFGRVESHCFGCENVFQGEEAQSIAERVFTDAIRQSPGRAQAHYLLAYLRETQGNPAGALQPLRAAVGIDGRYLNAWKRLDDLADKTYIEPGERDIARLKLLELDPMRRHGYYRLEDVGDLAGLWHGATRARETGLEAAPPLRDVYALPASSAGQNSALESLPPEMRRQMEQALALQATYVGNATSPPAGAVLFQNNIVASAADVIGLQASRGLMD